MITPAECESQAADATPGKQQQGCARIAIHDRYFRLDDAELELDGEPGRSPDQHRDRVENRVTHEHLLQS